MLRWLESRIDPFKRPATPHPPRPLWAFYWHFVEPVLPWFLVVLVLDLLTALTEVALAKFVADLIDLLKGIGNPASLFADHAGGWGSCGWRPRFSSHPSSSAQLRLQSAIGPRRGCGAP